MAVRTHRPWSISQEKPPQPVQSSARYSFRPRRRAERDGRTKTKKNDASVEGFLTGVENERRREDSFVVLEMMKRITGEVPTMWGSSIVGFGSYHYRYASGREGDWPRIGFSPRKQSLTL